MPSAWQKKEFVRQLRRGGVVAYPTEAVYGLGCDPLNLQAVLALQALKKRSLNKGLILIAADYSQLSAYVKELPGSILKKIQQPSEHAITWLLPVRDSVPSCLTGGRSTIAVRLVQHPLAKELCELAQTALVSTSANISGQNALRTAHHTRLKFAGKGVYTINGRVGSASKPSQIIDALSGKKLR